MASKPSLSVLIEQGPKSGHRLQCRPRGRVTIGRAKANTLQISKDSGISQKHLAFLWVTSPEDDDAGWSVTDLGSSNGTLLNNLQIEPNLPISIKDGDLIKIGAETTIRILIPSLDLETSKAPAVPKIKGISKHAESPANDTSVLEEHSERRTQLAGEKHQSRHIDPAEDNYFKEGPASVEHRRGTYKERGGREPECAEYKPSGKGVDLSMTVEQWFAHLMEEGPKYLHRVSESMIQDILQESKQFDEYIMSSNQNR